MGLIPSLSECDPGLYPVEFNVLILPEPVEEKKGSIILPDQVKEMDKSAQTRGRLVAVSPVAFDYAEWPEGSRRPAPGDEVWFGKYAGVLVTGRDGREYRLCKDRDVGAVAL